MIMIYALICHANNMAYVGSTKGKLAKRMREHRCLLNQGTHKVSRMQADWQKYGSEQFSGVELQTLDADLSIRRGAELRWMRHYAELGLLYNEHLVSMRPTDEAIRKGVAAAHLTPGNRWTAEANLKRRIAQLGKPKGHGAKIGAAKRARREQMMI